MLPEDVEFKNKLDKFIKGGFKLYDFSQELFEEVVKRFELTPGMMYESFFSSYFLSSYTQREFLKLCLIYGYSYDKELDKLTKELTDLIELRHIQNAMYPNYKEL